MIIKEGTEIGTKAIIKASDGRMALNVKEFNTETKEAVLYAMVVHDDKSKRAAVIGKSLFDRSREVVTFTCHLLGYNAYNKETGDEIK
jgi:hypothetical protein